MSGTSGYATHRVMNQRSDSPIAASNSFQSTSGSNFSKALVAISGSLPNYASLDLSLKNGNGQILQNLNSTIPLNSSSINNSLSMSCKSPIAVYYSRRISSAQHGKRLNTKSHIMSTQYPPHGDIRGACISSLQSQSILHMNHSHRVNSSNGIGGLMTSASTGALVTIATPKNATVSVATPRYSNGNRSSSPRNDGGGTSPIQTKKKSVRWSESLVSFDAGKRVNDANTQLLSSRLSSGSVTGDVSVHVVKTSISIGNSNNRNTIATVSLGSTSANPSRPSTAPHSEQPSSAQLQIHSSISVPPAIKPLPPITRSSSCVLPTVGGAASSSTCIQNSINNNNGKSLRPSLSEQLAAIGCKAEALTQEIRQKAGLSTDSNFDLPLFVVPAKSLSIGTLNCRYPAPARFYSDRIEYTFHHPFEPTEVEMSMYYRDMLQTALVGGKLKFKLPRYVFSLAFQLAIVKYQINFCSLTSCA